MYQTKCKPAIRAAALSSKFVKGKVSTTDINAVNSLSVNGGFQSRDTFIACGQLQMEEQLSY